MTVTIDVAGGTLTVVGFTALAVVATVAGLRRLDAGRRERGRWVLK